MEAEINLQWKNTDACYDFYCPCGYEGINPADAEPGDPREAHRDGFFQQEYQCAGCGQWWHLPNKVYARPGRFFREDNEYGCEACANGHQPDPTPV